MFKISQQESAFAAHIQDLLFTAEHRCQTRFTGFLDLRQAAIARQLSAHQESGVFLYGGYPDAERVVFGAFAPFEKPSVEAFDIAAITAHFRSEDNVTHRDFLGALLNLGLARETIGDILVEKGRAVCFLMPSAARLILSELPKVGRWGIRWDDEPLEDLPEKQFLTFVINVSSVRLDCVVAAVVNLSREKAQCLIHGQSVLINGAVVQENSYQVALGDVLSIRGHGKYIVDEVLRTTKKERLVLQCRKYV